MHQRRKIKNRGKNVIKDMQDLRKKLQNTLGTQNLPEGERCDILKM